MPDNTERTALLAVDAATSLAFYVVITTLYGLSAGTLAASVVAFALSFVEPFMSAVSGTLVVCGITFSVASVVIRRAQKRGIRS